LDHWDRAITVGIALTKYFQPVGRNHYDIDLIIAAISDTSEDILQCNEAKQETMYEIIEAELQGVQQALHSSRTVSTALLPS
jgi:preprotein translocase subunit SecB